MKILNLLILFVFYSFYSLSQQCPTVPTGQAGPDKFLCPGGSTTIGTTTGPASLSYSWFPTTGLSNPAIRNPIASPTTTTTYTLTVSPTTPNIIPNGDFEQVALMTDYGLLPMGDGTCFAPNPYGGVAFTTNPQSLNGNWCNMTDHTATGTRMLAVDGSCNSTRRIWFRTVPVTANTTYNLSGFATSLWGSNPTLVIRINGVTLATYPVPYGCSSWGFFSVPWQSGANTMANIEIRDNVTVAQGNDLALDDLAFRTCPTITDQVVVNVAGSAPVVTPGNVTYYNAWESITYPVTLTSTPAPSYQWYKNNVAIPGATNQTYVITYYSGLGSVTDSYKVVIPCGGSSNIVPFNYIGTNSDAQYPVPLPPPILCGSTTYPITVYAPSAGYLATYQWWSETNPTCYSFSPSQGLSSTTGFTVNFPCPPYSGGGIYTLSRSNDGQTLIYMYYRRQINSGCRPAHATEADIDSISPPDTLETPNPPKVLNIDVIPVAETLKKSVLVPNPASGQVLIRSPHQIISVQIYNLSGVLVKTLKPNKSQSLSIDITKFNPGYYNCSVLTDKGKEDLKLLVQK